SRSGWGTSPSETRNPKQIGISKMQPSKPTDCISGTLLTGRPTDFGLCFELRASSFTASLRLREVLPAGKRRGLAAVGFAGVQEVPHDSFVDAKTPTAAAHADALIVVS